METSPKNHHIEIKTLTRSNSVTLRNFVDYNKRFYVGKRIFDFTFSLIVTFLVLSWLFPLIALLIWLDSPGPILFIQRRVGLGGKTFRCFKFRTMISNNEANSREAQDNDVRITKIGQFLRLSNLDEFPQFFNVLKGDMSIVGPRPHMHADCTKFSSVINGYKFRNMVKPGITGLAQVKGYRGPAKDFKSIFHRYQFDAFYIRNANFWLDMRIIRKTAGQTLVALVKKLNTHSRSASFTNRKWVMAIRSFLS